ncbi:phosphate/phosphite/phosphonate ABC transporter substrate-binding protein [Psychromonas antarctica]|uniref:phosphate/phosphite/phosphonate ABC transporter substrate-binding protein n=1 Tax=Psychromonas antarctica TaxID=67573 RepID=UPI001EE9AB2E|nr:phosphate/phosphite/phosphonate ABC transporter substrate-binding protein [Psychromonas antarctica]MCG6200061.1 phosphate/phosphite/phosphonate ABC transporter substrate-binding protein [Psychromonas antarctica]
MLPMCPFLNTTNAMINFKLAAIITLLVICFMPHNLSAQEASNKTIGKTLVIGKVSGSPKKHLKSLKLLANYLVSHMQDLGYTKGKVLLSRSEQELARHLQQGEIDLVTETPFSTMYLLAEAGVEPILRKWKKGIAEYHSVIFVRKDSGINRLQDLKGKTIAFEDPNSTVAYYIPAYDLITAGLNLEQLNSPREKAKTDFAGYIFSQQVINTSLWVHKGRVNAGAMSNLDWQKNDRMPDSFHPDLKIIHRSISIPRAIEVLRKGLPFAVKARIKILMLNIDKDPDADEILRSYQQTRNFDELNGQTLSRSNKVDKRLNIVDEATQ